jgi:hypothetical protein
VTLISARLAGQHLASSPPVRAQVKQVMLRHTLVDQRGEWQQRIQAVLYHHGFFLQRHGLLTADNGAWLVELDVPNGARADHRRA